MLIWFDRERGCFECFLFSRLHIFVNVIILCDLKACDCLPHVCFTNLTNNMISSGQCLQKNQNIYRIIKADAIQKTGIIVATFLP